MTMGVAFVMLFAKSAEAATLSPSVLGALVAGVLFALAIAGVQSQLKRLKRQLAQIDERLERAPKEQPREDFAQVKNALQADLGALRSLIETIPSETERRIAQSRPQAIAPAPASAPAPAPRPFFDDAPEDGVSQLLTIANRLVRQDATTLDQFRATAGRFGAQVWPWPNAASGKPVAFIVDLRGEYYAVPNVVKAARFPDDWFNRAEFGMNDEIQRIVSLPKLRRRGDDYEVAQPGVFER